MTIIVNVPCHSEVCAQADKLLDTRVLWNEALLIRPGYGEKEHKAMLRARKAHEKAHASPSTAWECIGLTLERRGWPDTVWQYGTATTTWKPIKREKHL